MKSKFLLLLLCLAAVAASALRVRSVRAADEPRRIEITAKRFSYTPSEITLKKGQPVVIVIKSLDVAHGLRIREFDLNANVSKGGTAELRFTPDKVGDFMGHCSVFCGAGHGTMMLTLHVVD